MAEQHTCTQKVSESRQLFGIASCIPAIPKPGASFTADLNYFAVSSVKTNHLPDY